MKRKIAMILTAVVSVTPFVFSEPPSPVPKTGQTVSYRVGDDGDLETGVAWPGLRFTDLSDGTVRDNLTGLEWVQAPHALHAGGMWDIVIDFCNNLVYAGHSDWRLPSIQELESLVNCGLCNPALPAGHPFAGMQNDDYYWSGTSRAGLTSSAWCMNIGRGSWSYCNKIDGRFSVWPVRGGQ